MFVARYERNEMQGNECRNTNSPENKRLILCTIDVGRRKRNGGWRKGLKTENEYRKFMEKGAPSV